MKSRFLIAGAALAVLAVPLATAQLGAQATSAVAGKAHIGSWGFDLTGLDTAVKPGDDFFRYMAGKWDDRTEIPADRPSVGSFNDLRETTGDQVKTLITAAPANSKIGAFYSSFMDEKRLEAIGLAPLKRDLAKVNAIQSKAQFAGFMGGTNGVFGDLDV
jgi:putative endopeptidase